MKSSKHVETCFVRANNDFDDKLTAFSMEKNFGQKSPKTDTVALPIKGAKSLSGAEDLNLVPILVNNIT